MAKYKKSKVRNDRHARELIQELGVTFSEASLDGDSSRYRDALDRITKIGHYMNLKGYGPAGKLDFGSRTLSDGNISTRELAEYTNLPMELVRNWMISSGIGRKIGRSYYVTKKTVMRLNPEWFSELTDDEN